MSYTEFLPFALMAGAAFGSALLWMLVQWMRADEVADSIESEVKRGLGKLSEPTDVQSMAMTNASPHGVPIPVVPHTPDAPVAAPQPARTEADDEAEEKYLAPLLFKWGTAACLGGMVVGGWMYSFVGALLGAVGGSVLATVGVVVAVSLREPSAARVKEASKSAETESNATVAQDKSEHPARA